ncbi:MAG: hypothetical protein RLZZ241_885 [Bacteroidota bacterium]
MKEFAVLIQTLDATNKINNRVAALATYFKNSPDRDKVWTIALLSHRRPSRPVTTTQLRLWAGACAGISPWLFEETYHIVGDLAETIALIIPRPSNTTCNDKCLSDYLNDLILLKNKTEAEQQAYLMTQWANLNYYECFVFTKIMTGGFRIGISQKLMTRALAQATEVPEDLLAYRLMGNWDPARITFSDLVLNPQAQENSSRPYPFFLAYALEETPDQLGEPENWLMEYKWDGIRAQLIIREGKVFLWSRGEELVTDSYPEFATLANILPNGSVLDGELLPFPNGKVGSFNLLQKRLGRKTVTKSMLQKIPVILRIYDLLECNGSDIRKQPFSSRRKQLELWYHNLANPEQIPLDLSPILKFESWDTARQARELSRNLGAEGLMLKHRDTSYGIGRKKGGWWKWKVDPMTVDAVLTYAMRGHGRRSNMYTDYTFALWKRDQAEDPGELVTFAKAYSGLTDAELLELDLWIKANTTERFGPVRAVTPELVFEIGFEGLAHSGRHKSGIATRFPRILRWRKDKTAKEADNLESLKKMIPPA